MKRLAILAGVLGLSLAAVRAQEAPEPFVHFNFEQVELSHLVNLVGAQTGKRFVMDASVTGRVSVITREQIPLAEVFPLFVSVLEGSGYTVVDREGTFHIRRLPADDPLQAPVVGADSLLTGTGLITRVLRLQHIRATDVRPLLEPMVRQSKQGSLAAFGPTNHLIITDTASNIGRIESLLAELDKPGQSTTLTVLPLQHASARELAREISLALQGAESAGSQVSRQVQQVIAGGGALPVGFSLVASEQANALIVSAGPLQLQEIRAMVAQLDIPPDRAGSAGRLRAVFLNYLPAEAAAQQLTALLAQRKGEKRDSISVQADVSNNAVLVDANPLEFAALRELLRELDRPPQQVLVEVLLVEVAEGGSLDLGVEWATIEQPKDGVTTVIGRSRPGETDDILDLVTRQAFPQGLGFGVARGTMTLADGSIVPRIPFLLRALAGNRDVKILSNVPLRTQNNTKATMSVVENIPVLRSVITGGTGDNRDVIQNIDRLDVGIKLTVTPQVNPNREITLTLNPVIEAIIDEQAGDTQLTPTIARREVTSTVTLPDRATVVISGLMREDVVKEESRVPVLGRLPLLGFLFRSTSERTRKTNLLIFVTPYLVTDAADDAEATRRWEGRTGLSSQPAAPMED